MYNIVIVLFACIFILLCVMYHCLRHGALGKGGEVFFLAFLSVYFSFMLTVDEILSILEDYNDMGDADIFMEPPANAEAREDKTFSCTWTIFSLLYHFSED